MHFCVHYRFIFIINLALFPISPASLHAQTYPFKQYSTADGLMHPAVRKVFPDSHGYLWFGTRGGVNRYDANEFVTYLTHDSMKSDIFDIWEDDDLTLRFATYGNGLAKKSADDTTFMWIKASGGTLPSDLLTCLYRDYDRNIWIGSGDGLALWKAGGTTHIYKLELGEDHGEVYSFAREKNGTVWIGTHGGLLFGQLGADNRLKLNKIFNKPTRSLLVLKNGDVLAGTSGGSNDRYGVVCRFHNGVVDTLISYQTTYHLIKAQALFEDSIGRIWVGTEYGLYLVQDGNITHLQRENGLYNENIYNICEDREGTIWLGTENGVLKLVVPVFLTYGLKDGLSRHQTLCMLLDHRQQLWFGMWNGLNRMKSNGRIQYWDDTHGLRHHTVNSLAEDATGNIWIGTELGLNLFVSGKIVSTKISGIPEQSQIWSICRDQVDGIWVGVKGKIAKFIQDRTSVLLGQDEGVPNDVIAPLFVDQQQRLWFGTEHSLFEWTGRAMHHYTTRDGLVSDIVTQGIVRNDGSLWFGTQDGISTISQPNRLQAIPVPVPYPDRVMAGDNERQIENHSVVKYADRSIVSTFNALSFVDEKSLAFQWMLHGFDNDWSDSFHQRRVRYTNLSPGKYAFFVRAANRNGDWASPAQFDFTIRSPYCETWWFVTLVVAFIAAVIFLFYHSRINQIRKIERMRSRIAADLHDDIASSLASVSLYSEVIQRQVLPESGEIRSLLHRIRDLSQEVMENINTIVWTVDPRRDELSELLHYLQRYARQMCTTARVNFTSQIPEHLKSIILTPEQRRTMYLIFKEAMANILRHAASSEVSFSCTYLNHIIDLRLSDNGQGFDPKTIRDGHGLPTWLRGHGQLARP